MFTEQERLKITFEIKHHTDDSSSFLVSLVLRRIKTYGFIFIYLCPGLLGVECLRRLPLLHIF